MQRRAQWIRKLLTTLLTTCVVLFFSSATFAQHKTSTQKKHRQKFVHPSYKPDHNTYRFMKNEILGGYYDKSSMNVKFPHPPSPIFWNASTKVDHGIMLIYMRNIYHSQKHFAVNLGLSSARWTLSGQSIYAFSFFVAFKIYIFRTQTFNPYIFYSVAGATGITRRHLGPARLGENFLFQDLLGLGVEIGHNHVFDAAVIIVHYSNGDIFTHNNGFGVPILATLGYAFP